MHKNAKKSSKYLVMSKKSSNFAGFFTGKAVSHQPSAIRKIKKLITEC